MKFRLRHRINPLALFYLKISLVISLVIVAVYTGIYLRNNRLLLESAKQQAASYFDLIVRVRRWNANYGGVYAEKKPGVESNKYLREVELAERIRERIESAVHGKVPSIRITISIGVASLDGDDTPETLLKRADNALYRAKKGADCAAVKAFRVCALLACLEG